VFATQSPSPPLPISHEPGDAIAQIEDLRIDPAVFRIGGHGASISYKDSRAARASFTVLRAVNGVKDGGHRCVKRLRRAGTRTGGRCRLYVPVAAFVHSDRAATNHFGFSGHIGANGLSSGLYQLQVAPIFDGRSGVRRAVSFRIVG
jgi:hypothetical protein